MFSWLSGNLGPWLYAICFAAGLAAGSYVVQLRVTGAVADIKEDFAAAAADQRELTAKVDASNIQNTSSSTARLDVTETARETEVKYVDRKVIEYVVKYRDSACPVPDEWVSIYNSSLGLPEPVPSAAKP